MSVVPVSKSGPWRYQDLDEPEIDTNGKKSRPADGIVQPIVTRQSTSLQYLKGLLPGLPFSDEKQPPIPQKSSKISIPPPPMVSLWTLLFRYASKIDICCMIAGTTAAVLLGAGRAIWALLMGYILDGFYAADYEQVRIGCLWMFAQGASCLFLNWVQAACWIIQAERRIQRIRELLLKSMLRQEMSWFDSHRTGILSGGLNQDVNEIQEAVGDKMGLLIYYLASCLAVVVTVFIKGWHLALGFIILIPVVLGLVKYSSVVTKKATRRALVAYASANEVADQSLTSIRTVTLFGGQPQEGLRYSQELLKAKIAEKKKAMISGLTTGLAQCVSYVFLGLILFFGAYLIVMDLENPLTHSTYTGGDIISIFWAFFQGAIQMGRAAGSIGVVISGRTAAHSVFEMCERKSLIDPFATTGLTIPDLQGRITFDSVKFAYPGASDVPVLHDVSFDVQPGSAIALVGHAGCGKSTACKLIARFYDASSGTVLLDGHNVRTLNVHWLRRQIGIVDQEPVLFATTIKENMRLAKPNATDEEIVEACKLAEAHSFIMDLQNGYDTFVGDAGGQLSGGQKQRIAIARALIQDPKILLLDEATSALDSSTERLVQAALNRLMKGRTVIVVAHRLSTIRNVDVIHVFQRGRIVESGSHDQLVLHGGHYADLVQAYTENEKEHVVEEDMSTSMRRRRGSWRFSLLSDGSFDGSQLASEDAGIENDNEQMWKLLSMVRGHWGLFALGIVGTLMNGIIYPVFAILYTKIIDIFYKYSGETELLEAGIWCGALIALGFYILMANVLQFGFVYSFGAEMTYKLRELSFRSLLRQSMGYFDDERHNPRKLTTRLQTDAGLVQSATALKIAVICQMSAAFAFGFAVAFWASWKLTLYISVTAPIIVCAGVVLMKLSASLIIISRRSYEEGGQWAGQALAHIRTIASLGSEQQFVEKYSELLQAHVNSGVRYAHIYGAAGGFHWLAVTASFSLAFWLGYTMFIKEEVSLANVMQVVFAVIWNARDLSGVFQNMQEIAKGKYAVSAIVSLLELHSAIDPLDQSGERVDFAATGPSVDFRNVTFAYPTRRNHDVLRHLNLSVPAGSFVALVGHSGCGKSTTLSLVPRLYDTSEGCVCIDGKDVRDLNIAHMRKQIAVVSQEPVLFAGSILDNIRYGCPDAPFEDVVEAAKLCNAHSFIMKLPNQYNTYVGSRGSQLSGGQKQLVAIARAVVMKPRILLLDEATSALDANSEQSVQEALKLACKGRTTIAIAHKLSTILHADLIAFVCTGSVAEMGRHEDLMKLNGQYAALVRQSFLGMGTSEA